MIIGIDGSRAFLKERTGIEEYSYQVIKHLINELRNDQVVLYIRSGQKINFALPKNWKIKIISWPYFWTQIGLSLEMLLHPVDALFIPAHIVPLFSAKKTVVTMHGLEYEFVPEAYPLWERIYMRFAIKKSCRRAEKIIAVSENTKKDLVKLYKVPEEKISVIYEGYVIASEAKQSNNKNEIATVVRGELPRNDSGERHLLFIGRLEERKNIIGIIQAFEILKEKYKIPHKLILAGKPGFNYKKIQSYLSRLSYKSDIILPGFISEEEKRELLKNAEVFLFPTFYEGFGLPILEAQNAGVSVVASIEASIPEVAGDSAILVDPKNPQEIAEAIYKLITNKNLREDMIKKGLENTKRFSWKKCASQIAKVLKG
jgi:glycosyltransferase involved in cell wall biosynthesis